MIPVQPDALLADLRSDASIYPFQLDLVADRVLLARLPVAAQDEAVFLDQRALTASTQGAWCDWRAVEDAARGETAAPAYIFHVGHCGSTLLSRLVAAAAGAPPLREPLPLRSVAIDAADALSGSAYWTDADRARRVGVLETLWARRQGVVLKATSMCGGLVDAVSAASPAAFVFIRPEIYLALLLGGANSHIDLKNFGPMRARRLRAMWPAAPALASLRPGELAAMSWLVETASIAAASRPLHVIDFDHFLADPAAGLAALCAHLQRPAGDDAVAAAVRGPLMGQYSKAPNEAYDATLRARIIAEDSADHAAEIRAGMAWLARAGAVFPEAAAALDRFGG